VLMNKLRAFVARPVGLMISVGVVVCVISFAYSGFEWWEGDPTAWKAVALDSAILLLFTGNLVDASCRKTRLTLVTTSCLLIVAFYAGIVVNANHPKARAHNTVERH
jgi:hypothetical protein